MAGQPRREFIRNLTASAAALGTGGSLQAASAKAARPNILFLMTDQQHAQALSAAGNPYLKTPGMDSLAARGMRFEKSYCTNPLCCPARASLFTSRMPHELGIYENGSQAELSEKGVPTLGELFRTAGYETAYAGKWHLRHAYPTFKRETILGFEALPLAGKDPHKADKNKEGKGLLVDPNTADAAIAYLQRPHPKPFFLVASMLNPHDICEYDTCALFNDMLPPDPEQLPPKRPNTHAIEGRPTALEATIKKGKSQGWTDRKWREYLWVYYRLVEKADAELARVLAALDQAGLASSTVVLFTSDHGEMMGSHELFTKQRLYDEATSVPMLIAAPGSVPGVDSRALVSGLDVLPTLLDYAGIAAPAPLLGRSLRPLVEGKEAPWRDFVVSETMVPAEARMVRTARYKYHVYAQGENREQLFDMEADPGETRNLAAVPSLAVELERHRALLKQWIVQTRDPFGNMPTPGKQKKKSKAGADEDG